MAALSGWSPLVPLLAVLVGAALGYLSGRLLETRKQLTLEKGRAYSDYLKALATAAIEDRASALLLAADAKTRICVYGAPSVIRALADFERAGASVLADAGHAEVAQLVSVMRADMGVRGRPARENDLHMILFGQERRT